MSRFKMPGLSSDDGPDAPRQSGPPPIPSRPFRRGSGAAGVVGLILLVAIVYAGYFWFIRRVVVGPDEVLVLLKKDGHHSLPDDQIIIPRAPDTIKDPAGHATWTKEYGDCNGIIEEVFLTGTYFRFSPFDYEREIVNIKGKADVESNKVGITIKKFGKKLPPTQVLADPAKDQRGPLPGYLQPGRHYQYANPYAYEIKQVDYVQIEPGHRGVVTVMAGTPPVSPNAYLVNAGEQGAQRQTEPPGFLYINPFEKRVTPVSIRSQRLEMSGAEVITFPSSDSFEIKLEGFVEWAIVPDQLPETYVKYSEGGELIPLVERTMILPYARSYSRLVGSQYSARDFISGDTKLKFQAEFEARLKEACRRQGVEVLQALVRDIIPPTAIKAPINEREIAREQILQYEQQMKVAQSMAKLATQEEQSTQNMAIGDENKAVVKVVKTAEQSRDVALTKAQQDLAVAKLRLDAAQKQADALVAKGQAEAAVILLQKQAEAEPLRQQVAAFGSGEEFARSFFYTKVAPSMKTIISNTDGPFADLFRQFTSPQQRSSGAPRNTEAQP